MTTYADKTELKLEPPEVGTDSLADQLDNLAPDVQAINWVYEQVRGKDMFTELIEPLTGDFNRIRANGEAWNTVATAIENISDNLTHNADDLRTHWTHGRAADAFEIVYIKGDWFAGCYATAEACRFVKKGFDVLADQSIRVAQAAVKLLQSLIHKLENLATKLIPGGGWAKAGADAVIDVFQGKVPIVSEIEEVVKLVQAILDLQDTITKIVDSAKAFFEGCKEIGEAIKQIPSIQSGNDAVAVGRQFHQGTQDVNQAKQDFKDGTKQLQGDLDTISKAKVPNGQ
ncbi:hypothetical protein FPZ12_030510 [Amycolatopsis acidicola]|uniref:WXG100 family type VII secretion target n=1 Tax=Amycolatopsis acidicola TaxID=2596893 RepID=A0A5N0UWC0_9PSEU|nr:hypothetical protein [Amycolatopsis acidicola]KAA9155175.1 hypothetical protein FPZ12_030510 [Amycolatopsis acidicola]